MNLLLGIENHFRWIAAEPSKSFFKGLKELPEVLKHIILTHMPVVISICGVTGSINSVLNSVLCA